MRTLRLEELKRLYSFLHSFQQIGFECLLCIRPCSEHWGGNREQESQSPWPQDACILGERPHKHMDHSTGGNVLEENQLERSSQGRGLPLERKVRKAPLRRHTTRDLNAEEGASLGKGFQVEETAGVQP